MKVSYFTACGHFREINEDGILLNSEYVAKISMTAPKHRIFEEMKNLFVVSDGMGGHKFGDKATELVLDSITNYNKIFEKDTDCNIISEMIINAKMELDEYVLSNQEANGLGVALAGIFINKDKGYIFNVGDSRVYTIVNKKYLYRLTQDHSLVELWGIPDEERVAHKKSHILTSAVIGGVKDINLEIYCKKIDIEKGQRFLICSDGVWGAFPPSILERFFVHEDIEEVSESLYREVLKRSDDNISFIFIDI